MFGVYIYIYIYIYIYTHTHTHIYYIRQPYNQILRVCMHKFFRTYIHKTESSAFINVCMHVCIRVCAYISNTLICIYVCMYVCMYVYIYACILVYYTHMQVWCVFSFMYVHVICIHVYILSRIIGK